MADSYDFDDVDLFTVGTLGPKGERVFYLQCAAEGSVVSLKLEKQQVAALAEFLDRVLDDLPDAEPGEPPEDLALHEPVVAAWTVGSLGVAYRDEDDNPTRRTVRPLALAFYGRVWLLVSWCELRDDFRSFRLDRMRTLQILGDTFAPEPGKTIDDYLRQNN